MYLNLRITDCISMSISLLGARVHADVFPVSHSYLITSLPFQALLIYLFPFCVIVFYQFHVIIFAMYCNVSASKLRKGIKLDSFIPFFPIINRKECPSQLMTLRLKEQEIFLFVCHYCNASAAGHVQMTGRISKRESGLKSSIFLGIWDVGLTQMDSVISVIICCDSGSSF